MQDITISQLIRMRRSSISLQVNSEGKLIVRAPILMPKFLINRFIAEKSEWITKRMKAIEDNHSSPKKYINGEEFLFLGKIYVLEIVPTNSIPAGSRMESTIERNYSEINISDKLYVPKMLAFRIKKELENWYIRQAKEIIMQRVNFHAKEMDTTFSVLAFSDTKSKWGSCSPDNSLQFNWRLIMAPLMVLDYVVIHELAHTKHKNHSHKFWNEVGKYTPAYRQHRKWLRTNGHTLII